MPAIACEMGDHNHVQTQIIGVSIMCLLMGIVGAVGGFYYRFNSLDIDGQYFNEVIWQGGIVGAVSAFVTLLVLSAAANEK